MTRNNIIAALALATLTSCEFASGIEIPVGNGYCVGVGVGTDGDKLDWADVSYHECIPDGYYTCDSVDVGYTGAFGGATCQGAYAFPDAYTVTFVTTSQVTLATVTYETDMMESTRTDILYPVHIDDSNLLFVWHVPNPGYGSDGDRIEFKIETFIGDALLAPPVVSAQLDGVDEDVRCDEGGCKSSW